MTTTRLEERFAYTGGRVDRNGPRPIVRDVLLCGPTSANRRRYKKEAFAGERVKKYDGRPVYLNHGDGRTGRNYEARIAKVINPRLRADGMPIGDLEVRPKHPYAEVFLDDAEHDAKSLGMSHVAHCQTKRGRDGWEDVHAVEEVESVDVVLDPATTKGLFEGRKVPTTLRAVIESVRPKLTGERASFARKLLLLAEDDAAMGDIMDSPVETPDEGTDPDQAIDDAFKQAMHAQVDALLEDSHSLAEFLSKIRELYKSRAKILGKAEPKDGGEGGSGGGSEKPEEESKKRHSDAILEALDVCKAVGFTGYSTDDLEAIAAAKPDRRKVIAESYKRLSAGGGAETPISTPRDKGKQTKESKTATGTAPGRITWD